jgi:pilus assembly protein CpaC
MSCLRAVAAIVAAGALLVFGEGHAFAQRPNPDRPAAARPVRPATPAAVTPQTINRPQELIGAAGQSIDVDVHKGVLVRLRQPAGSVFIANPEIADIQVRSPTLIYLFGKKAGQTALYAVDDQEQVLLNTTVTITHNLTSLRDQLRVVVPNEDVRVETVDNSLVISGTVTSAEQAEEVRRIAARVAIEPGSIINQLKITTPNQVNLRVRIAEVKRDALKVLGFNWDIIKEMGNFTFGIATGVPTDQLRNIVASAATSSLGAVYTSGNDLVSTVIDALSREGLVTILAEPNLTALSGETASFLSGGEFPFPVPVDRNTIAIEFKQFGVSLAFTPTILGGDRISMKVRPEVSQLATSTISINGLSVPSLTTRRAETTVELGSGQAFAIAGLLQNNSVQQVDRTPGLSDIPILGNLFRSSQLQNNETEIVIIITPYIVRPVSQKPLQSPTDGFVIPNDVERYVGGQTYRQQLPERSAGARMRSGQTLVGPAGFVLE